MLKLSQTERFIRDLEKFTKGIELIQKPLIKKEYQDLLKKFKNQCFIVDNAHSSEFNGNIKPEKVRENIIEMTKLRKKLNQYLNDA